MKEEIYELKYIYVEKHEIVLFRIIRKIYFVLFFYIFF